MTISRIAVLALIACSFSASGCSSNDPSHFDDSEVAGNIQRVDFDLTSPDGASVETLSYTLTNTTSGAVKTDTLDVSRDEELTFGLLLRHGNYRIAFSGTGSFEGEELPCVGATEFTVAASSNPTVHVEIVCQGDESIEVTGVENGQVDVDATLTVNHEVVEGECGFTHAVIGPLTQRVAHPINVESEFVVAPDATGHVVLSASAGLSGAFDTTTTPATYTCNYAGSGTITATLSSNIEGCSDTVVADVTCVDEVAPPSENLLSSRGGHGCWVLPAAGDRRLVCWGSDRSGVLGNGPIDVAQSRANVVDTRALEHGLDTRWRSIHTGIDTTCGITLAGEAYCWGGSPMTGNGLLSNTEVPTPVDVSGLPAGTIWSMISPGSNSTCGVTAEGMAYCWGVENNGKLGNGPALTATQYAPSPVDISALTAGTTWSTISSGSNNVCAITSAGAAYCWGSDSSGGMLGNGAITGNQVSPSPVDVSALPTGTTWTTISVGQQFSCALTTQGRAYCWGNDAQGQLGNGALGSAASPSPVDMTALPTGLTFTQLSAGYQHACALASDGSAWCWGNRAAGRLGNGTETGTTPAPVAVDVSLLPAGTRFAALSAGEQHTCGLTTNDTLYCWGSNVDGQLGSGQAMSLRQLRPEHPVPASMGVLLDHSAFSGAVGVENPLLPFTLVPLAGETDDVVVTATSCDENIVPNANVTVTGTGNERLLSITPIASGLVMTITVVVANGPNEYSFTIEYGASATPPDPTGAYYYQIADASTALDVGDGYVLLATDEANKKDHMLFLYKQEPTGLPLKTWGFTAEVTDEELDIEGAARVGDTIVWVGSQSNSSKDGGRAERRRVMFATTITGSGANVELSFAGRYGGGTGSKAAVANLGLWADLINWDKANGHGMGANALGFDAASQSGVFPTAPGGFNIEGLEFASDSTTGYLGFRAPTINVSGTQRALIVPLTNILPLVNGIGPQSGQAQFGAPILLDLAGRSIRELRRNASGEYLISAGPPENATPGVNDTWALYTWAGAGQEAVFNRELPNADLLTGGTWESIATIPDPLQSGGSVRLVTDSGDTVYYGYEQAKDVEIGHQKAYTQVFTLQ